ncbi:hypothetical protein [uncultured Chryseobacterium sp.]|uniref:hypothetical protein n=1 Tax=uncultured Chryseobacterium sp. TaxID=259322 RepID=UPI0025DFA983|nr:hypothetical protein [uncultured Chryseobacterium sp.]
MLKNNKIAFSISLVGFLVLFIYFNYERGLSDFFKSETDSFISEFSPIEIKKQKYLGEVADSSNHMNTYMSFGEICLPMLDQWKDKIEIGDYISKKRESLTILVERNNKKVYLYFDSINFKGAPLPCQCKALNKKSQL